ncbi:MAG: AAA family ATPase, partial [Columbia Basin potato purple top phytoplasma]
MGNMNKETLNFLHEIRDDQKSKKNDEMNNVKTFARQIDKLHGFSDIIGNEASKEQLRETVEQLKNLNLYKSMGSQKTPKGILLYGPPGTGKTYLAEAFAKEVGLPFFAVTSSDFSKTYVGEGPRLIKNLFDEARKNSPSVILIDECEVAFKKRHSDGLSSDHGNIITAFLSQIEGIYSDPEKPVFVIATTNFKDDIDNSILSRFNKLIEVDFWAEKDIVLFLKIISKNYNLDIRAYKYLEKISEQIINSGLNELRTPRKLIDLFEQATITAISKHKHLNILPIDLQLIMDRFTNKKNIINWDNHEHIKYDINELLEIKEYKNTPIKHLFVDSFFTDEEKKYFQLIQNGYLQNNKLVYNKDATMQTLEVDIDSNQLEKIKMFYSS